MSSPAEKSKIALWRSWGERGVEKPRREEARPPSTQPQPTRPGAQAIYAATRLGLARRTVNLLRQPTSTPFEDRAPSASVLPGLSSGNGESRGRGLAV